MAPDKTPPRGYALLWPRDLFHRELRAVLDSPVIKHGQRMYNAVDLILDEALRGPDPIEKLQQLRDLGRNVSPDPKDPEEVAAEFGDSVFKSVDRLQPYEPRRYYRHRRQLPVDGGRPAGPDMARLAADWTSTIAGLVDKGYLDRFAGEACSDSDNDRDARISKLLPEAAGADEPWPIDVATLPDDQERLFTLIEVFHDLVARPRTRTWHDFDHDYCWYDDFDERTGQALYRWKVNDLLDQNAFDLEVADAGEDVGFLVQRQRDPRQDLIHTTAQGASIDGNEDRVQHAVALFRDRNADTAAKRSACIALYGVLEIRRELVKEELLSRDERDLFEIANRFRIRHNKADQRGDYDDAYLDWLFWWYLGTVELTNRLIARSAESS